MQPGGKCVSRLFSVRSHRRPSHGRQTGCSVIQLMAVTPERTVAGHAAGEAAGDADAVAVGARATASVVVVDHAHLVALPVDAWRLAQTSAVTSGYTPRLSQQQFGQVQPRDSRQLPGVGGARGGGGGVPQLLPQKRQASAPFSSGSQPRSHGRPAAPHITGWTMPQRQKRAQALEPKNNNSNEIHTEQLKS